MGLRESIQNFFYAISHADEMVTKQKELARTVRSLECENSQLKEQSLSAQADAKRYQDNMQKAFLTTLPAELNAEEIRKIYTCVQDLDRSGVLTKQWYRAHERFGFLSHMGEKASDELNRIQYTNTLVELGVLPKDKAVYGLNPETRSLVAESVGAVGLPDGMPIGKIDYLATNGKVGETLWFQDAAAFLEQVYQDNFSGVPMSISVYSDPESGRHIDTFWVNDLDPIPQGFECVPFDPVTELASQFSKEQLSTELTLRQLEAEGKPIENIDLLDSPPIPDIFTDCQIRQAIGKHELAANTFHSIEECKISRLMGRLESNAWKNEQPQELYIHAGDDVIRLRGYVYEPGYEFFSATSDISLNGEILYGEDSRNVAAYRNETYDTGIYKSLDEAIRHIGEHVQSKEFILSDKEVLPTLEELYAAGAQNQTKQSLAQLVQKAEEKKTSKSLGSDRGTVGPER